MQDYIIGNMTIPNKISGNIYINDTRNKKIYMRTQYHKVVLSDFCITSIRWNDNSKDVESITLKGEDDEKEYNLANNTVSLYNRILKDCKPSTNNIVFPSNLPKRVMHFAINAYFYELVLLLVKQITNNQLEAVEENNTP